MNLASDILVPPVLVAPSTPIRELAVRLQESGADGACVVEDGRLVGVATTMDLLFRETTLHLPATIVFFEAVITLPGERARAKRELERIAAKTVGEMMTPDPITVGPTTTIQECADLMVHKHLTLLPVVDSGNVLRGVVTKDAMVRAAGLLSGGHAN